MTISTTWLAMNNSTIMKNIGHHEDDDYVKEESDEQIHDNSNNEANSKNEADEDYVIEEEDVASDEDFGKVDMAKVFPNTDDNPIEYIYIRDSNGRVVLVDFHLKVPRNEVDFIHNHNENGGIVDVECRFKKAAGKDDTTSNIDA